MSAEIAVPWYVTWRIETRIRNEALDEASDEDQLYDARVEDEDPT